LATKSYKEPLFAALCPYAEFDAPPIDGMTHHPNLPGLFTVSRSKSVDSKNPEESFHSHVWLPDERVRLGQDG
jgi:hypothetical protein